MQLSNQLLGVALLGHPQGYWAALLFNHRQVLDVVFVSIEKEFTSEKFDQDAGHRPDVALLVPAPILKDYLRCPILPSVYDQCVALVRVCGATEVDQLDLVGERLLPYWRLFSRQPGLEIVRLLLISRLRIL
jgi:hypothetical protein